MLRFAEWRAYGRLTPFIRPFLGSLSAIIAVSLVSTALNLAQPYISKLLIDDALLNHDMRALAWVAAVLVAVTLLGFALNIVATYRYAQVSTAMLFEMRLALFRHLQTLSPRFYARFRMGDLLSRLNSDMGEVQRVSADTILAILTNSLYFVGCIAMMAWLNWKLLFAGTVLFPVCVAVFVRFQGRLTEVSRLLRERSADLGCFFVDTMLGMRVITSLRAEGFEAERFRKRNDGFVQTMLRMKVIAFLAGALPATLLTLATAVVFLYGGWLAFTHEITIGTLVAFMAYHMRLLSPVQTLIGLASGLASARASLTRIFELFDAPAEVRETQAPRPLIEQSRSISFDHVSLRYDRDPVLVDVSFEIPHGTFCVILGPSGVGKSSLADLIVRYLDPDTGRVLLGGRDIRTISLADLRHEVILVDQTPYLFNATIAENITLGGRDSVPGELLEAARAAGLEELLLRLPDGFNTHTGERGLALSAGERQRVALARALFRRPAVLILDEPSAPLDAQTEQIIARGVREFLPDSTMIVITHRTALAAAADQIIELGPQSTRTAPECRPELIA